MSDLLRRYHLYDGSIRRLLLFTGLSPSANRNIFHWLLACVHGLSAVLISAFCFNFCYHYSTNLGLFLKGLGLAVSFMTMIQKSICFTIYRKRLFDLDASLASTFSKDFKDPDLRPILLSPLLSFYRPSLVLSIVTYTLIIMHWISPPIAIAVQRSRGIDDIKYPLPYPARYPWTIIGGSWLYSIHYIFEIYVGICIVVFCTAIDSLFGYYVFQISGQLRTLSHRLNSFKSTENYYQVLRKCVSRHQILIRCQKHLELIYGPIVLWMMVTNAIIMCAFIYQASHMSPGKAALVVLYIIMKATQILVYGFFGSFLATENDRFREAIYATDWAGSGQRGFMTDIHIMVTYTPLNLKACSLSPISVEMFLAVCNTSLSYFFMLRTLEEGNAA